jgi:hypothetical protein
MIVTLEKSKEENIVVAAETIAKKEFGVTVDEKLYSILSSRIYTDKIMAPIRELSCNAYDAHVAAGKPEERIRVRLPESADPTFSVQDFGAGMSVDTVMDLYTQYGASDKLSSNDVIGCWGLGSKSPFAYTKSFTVVTVHDGKRNVFIASVESGCPKIEHVMSEDTDDPTGTTVSFQVRPADISVFHNKAREFYRTFRPYPVIDDDWCEVPALEFKHGALGEGYCGRSARVLMGNVPYEVSVKRVCELAKTEDRKDIATKFKSYVPVLFTVPVGSVDIAVSRESIEYTDKTVDTLSALFIDLYYKACAEMEATYNDPAYTTELAKLRACAKHASQYSYLYCLPYADEVLRVGCTFATEYGSFNVDTLKHRIHKAWSDFVINPGTTYSPVVVYNNLTNSVSRSKYIERLADELTQAKADVGVIYVFADKDVVDKLEKKGLDVYKLSELRAKYAKRIGPTGPRKPKNMESNCPGWGYIDLTKYNHTPCQHPLRHCDVENLKQDKEHIHYYIPRTSNNTRIDASAIRSELYAREFEVWRAVRKTDPVLSGAHITFESLGIPDCTGKFLASFSEPMYTIIADLCGVASTGGTRVYVLSEGAISTIKDSSNFVNLYAAFADVVLGADSSLYDCIRNGLYTLAKSKVVRLSTAVDKAVLRAGITDFEDFYKAVTMYNKLSDVDKAVMRMVNCTYYEPEDDSFAAKIKDRITDWNAEVVELFPHLFYFGSNICTEEIDQYLEAMCLWHKKNNKKKGN